MSIATKVIYTLSVKAEVDESGKVHISFIKGEQLVDLLIEHQVGAAKVEHTVHLLDEDYWSEIIGDDISELEGQSSVIAPKKKRTYRVKFPLPIQVEHKGKVYNAELLDLKGNIKYAGRVYDSPSGAAKAVAVDWKSVNGWAFWRFLDKESGKWGIIGNLR
ncbi:hypothetical protein ACFLV7_04220 [Chloroflexota bacterium]